MSSGGGEVIGTALRFSGGITRPWLPRPGAQCETHIGPCVAERGMRQIQDAKQPEPRRTVPLTIWSDSSVSSWGPWKRDRCLSTLPTTLVGLEFAVIIRQRLRRDNTREDAQEAGKEWTLGVVRFSSAKSVRGGVPVRGDADSRSFGDGGSLARLRARGRVPAK